METFNPHSSDWLKNKFQSYKQLRQQDSLYFSDKYSAYIVPKYKDVMFALANPKIFSSGHGNLVVENPNRFGNTLGASDSPVHEKLKNVVKNAYSKDNIDRVISTVKPKIIELLKNKDTLNISEVTEQISAWTVAEILNLPQDKEFVKNLIVDIQRKSSSCVSFETDDTSAKEFSKIIAKATILDSMPAPGPGIYNEFVNSNPDGVATLSLFIGPTVSGASSMSGALQFLTLDICRTGKLEQLIKDSSLRQGAINESLRFNASTGRFSRTVTEEVVINNTTLKPNDRVILCLDSANRDPEEFENPDDFDMLRNTAGLAFGHGMHACIALVISKAVMSAYLDCLLDIVGQYEITTSPEDLNYLITSSGNNDMITNISIRRL